MHVDLGRLSVTMPRPGVCADSGAVGIARRLREVGGDRPPLPPPLVHRATPRKTPL